MTTTKKKTISKALLAGLCLAMASLTAGCTDTRVYDSYQHIPLTGWDKANKVIFCLPKTYQGGSFDAELSMRIDHDFPFLSANIIITQTVLPADDVFCDTIQCQMISEDGKMQGNGNGLVQCSFHIRQLQLSAGDSLVVSIQHDMMREIMPGIADVGYRLTRQ